MPRSGPVGTFTLPGAQATQVPGTPIPSAVNNQGWQDVEQTFNTATPIAYGGTNAGTAVGAADNLSPAFVNVASAAMTNIGAASSPNVNITGTTGITAFDTFAAGAKRRLVFTGILTLTHNATSLILPNGGANITTAAGDRAEVISLGSGNWLMTDYQRVSGAALSASGAGRNRVVNNDMRVSQENGTTPGTGNGFYPVDQWAQYRVTSAGVLTVAQVASVTPAGSPNRLRATVTTADASLAAGEYWTLSQNLEGSNVADFRYGAAGAFNSVLRFGFKGPAGTYAAHLGNSAANRSYVALFTITAPQANTDTVQTISIAGDVTGTWLTADGVIGITLDIVLAAGTTFQGALGWQAGNVLATSAISNGMGTSSAVFELFDVGLRLDPDATGVYGQYEVGVTDAVFRPERYYTKDVPASLRGYAGAAGQPMAMYVLFPVPMAKIPTIAGTTATATGNVLQEATEAITTKGYRWRITANATGDFFTLERLISSNARLS